VDTDRPHDVPTLADLTAAEIFVLRYAPAMRPDAEPLKLALQELVADGALRLVLAARRLSRGGRPVLIAGPAYAEPAAAALAPVLALHAEQGGEVPVPDVAKAARKAFGGPGGYAEHEVAPVLGARGLLAIERTGVRGRACYRRTPAGCVVDDVLERWLDQARRGTTTARLLEGGAAVLLLHHLYPRPGTLERVYAGRRSGNCTGDATLTAAAWSDPPDHSDVDVGDLSVATVLDDLASAFAWIDVGFPAGDGGGGGDGGGS